MAEIKGTKSNKPSRKPRGVRNSARPNGKAWKRHPKAFANGKLFCRNHGRPPMGSTA